LVAFKQICKFVISDIKQKLKGEKFSIISHSMGSAIVSVIFKKNRKQIEKIIFINPFTPMNPFLKIDKLDNLPQPNKNFLPSVTKIGKEYNLPKKNQKEVFYN
jgi:alpha-beta hydrolase superfamily lysophospholipase